MLQVHNVQYILYQIISIIHFTILFNNTKYQKLAKAESTWFAVCSAFAVQVETNEDISLRKVEEDLQHTKATERLGVGWGRVRGVWG